MDNEDTLKEMNQIEKEENKNEENANKKIEVITGNGNLTISPVYEHLEVEKPKPKENRKIFIPEVKGDSKPKEESDK